MGCAGSSTAATDSLPEGVQKMVEEETEEWAQAKRDVVLIPAREYHRKNGGGSTRVAGTRAALESPLPLSKLADFTKERKKVEGANLDLPLTPYLESFAQGVADDTCRRYHADLSSLGEKKAKAQVLALARSRLVSFGQREMLRADTPAEGDNGEDVEVPTEDGLPRREPNFPKMELAALARMASLSAHMDNVALWRRLTLMYYEHEPEHDYGRVSLPKEVAPPEFFEHSDATHYAPYRENFSFHELFSYTVLLTNGSDMEINVAFLDYWGRDYRWEAEYLTSSDPETGRMRPLQRNSYEKFALMCFFALYNRRDLKCTVKQKIAVLEHVIRSLTFTAKKKGVAAHLDDLAFGTCPKTNQRFCVPFLRTVIEELKQLPPDQAVLPDFPLTEEQEAAAQARVKRASLLSNGRDSKFTECGSNTQRFRAEQRRYFEEMSTESGKKRRAEREATREATREAKNDARESRREGRKLRHAEHRAELEAKKAEMLAELQRERDDETDPDADDEESETDL